jgi:hypothetical protein
MSKPQPPHGAQAVFFDWRKHLPIHPVADAFPELSPAELIALGNDIKVNGLRLPIVVHTKGDPDNPEFKLIDGRSRLDAMAFVGIEFKFGQSHCDKHGEELHLSGVPGGKVQMAPGFSDEEIKSLVASLNLHRRHLDAKGKRAAIDALLKLDPGKSDRQIAEQTKSSPTTVGTRRKKAETAGDVSKLDTRTDTKGRKQPSTKPKATESESCSPGFAATCARAARLGREVRRFDSGYQLTCPDDGNGPPNFTSLGALNQELREIAASSPPKDTPAEGEETHGGPPIEADDTIEDPAIVLVNVLDSIKQSKAVAEAYRKILKASTFDRGAKKKISDAIESLIRKWRSVQSTLAARENDDTPSGSGSAPEGEAENTEAPAETASTGTVSASEEPATAPVDPATPPLPPSPTPPTPAPTPPSSPSPKPKLGERVKVLPHYQPAHRVPWPKNWRELGADDLEAVIDGVVNFGVNHRLTEHHHRQLRRMRSRLSALRGAERAEARLRGGDAGLSSSSSNVQKIVESAEGAAFHQI